MTIKHLLYTQLCAFVYTKGACVVFFRFWNSPTKIFYVIETVASISDQREYVFLLCVTRMRCGRPQVVIYRNFLGFARSAELSLKNRPISLFGKSFFPLNFCISSTKSGYFRKNTSNGPTKFLVFCHNHFRTTQMIFARNKF